MMASGVGGGGTPEPDASSFGFFGAFFGGPPGLNCAGVTDTLTRQKGKRSRTSAKRGQFLFVFI